jgi:hypothetical protein
MFVRYFFVFDCYLLRACEQYILFTVFYYFSTTVVLHGLDCMLQSSFDRDEFNIQSGFYG